jgi:hypothetical protein
MTSVEDAPARVSRGRGRFIEKVDSVFAAAGISYAVLHGYAGSTVDSDVDVVVAKDELRLVDLLLRSGALGELFQVIHYDVPWCRYYVVASGDVDRPYRQLDVSCDPWGVSMLGRSLAVALDAASGAPRSRPTPAAEAFLLLAKRAHKGLRRPHDAAAVADVFAEDPAAATRLLVAELGGAGARASGELARGGISPPVLQDVWRATRRRRRTPSVAARRTLFSLIRLGRRLASPTGMSVAVAGPDGVGKSMLADALPDAVAGLFWKSNRLHLGARSLPPPGRLLGRSPGDVTEPHGRDPSAALPSFARLAYLWCDALVSWGPLVALPKRRSSLVLIERGWRDLEVDPRRYRMSLPRTVLRVFARAQPRPDLTLLLDAPAEVVAARKPELPATEVERQLREWRAHALAEPTRYVTLDASREPAEVVAAAREAIAARLASRHRRFAGLGLVFRMLGGLRRGGVPHAIVSARGEARWVLPARVGGAGPVRRGLYRPFRRRHAVGAAALELVQVEGSLGLRRAPLAVERGVGGTIAQRLGIADAELAAAATGDRTRGQRAVLSVSSKGRVVAFAKVAVEAGEVLLREARILDAVGNASTRTIVAPRVLDCFTWRDSTVLLVEPLPSQGPVDRELTAVELEALAELEGLDLALASTLGKRDGFVPVHGDFAPWNSALLPGGRLALWDWEEARLGRPLEDLFNWELARSLRGTGRPVREIVAEARRRGGHEALRRQLDALAQPPRADHPGVAPFRRRALALLETGA